MSNPDQPSTPPLTRRQLREIRNTGSTPVVTQEAQRKDAEKKAAQKAKPAAPKPAPVPLPRAVVPAIVPPAPHADASVDLGVSPLTRRQAREQERIRTASIPVIAPDPVPTPVSAPDADAEAPAPDAEETARTEQEQPGEEIVSELFAAPEDEHPAEHTPLRTAEAALQDDEDESSASEPAATVSPQLGSALIDGPAPQVSLPPSFDQLLSRESSPTGSIMTPNALILSQTPSTGSFTSPIASTGEILITGTFDLPEGLGSRGHAPGTTDGREADAVLMDGELPASSSPTPIAASAAVSTVRTADEIIRPPAPEKGSRLMLTLAITAGALALALVGVLILAVATGVFS
ncbi:hypothetical protein F6J84_08805 [Microbacterium caowuchunii]|uniref:hypothetical protein n=1 Tax=Microbacterium caowuchunii TaxID=2614638 RepID=UPI0012466141|nr:hypothetical protein [Microbacterium caowuchunii]QEW00174.1 hypothetical protein F6J84_08805 [Microbacterium caowuchunii]